MNRDPHDAEKNVPSNSEIDTASSGDEVPTPSDPAPKRGFLARLRGYEEALDRKLGVESHSIERKLPENRNPAYGRLSKQLSMFTFWVAGCLNLSCFATGFLGYELGLDLRQTLLIMFLGTTAGSLVSSWCATMGAPTGLRQVSICRFSFGWYPSKIIALLNVIQEVGWAASGSITGGLALSALSDGKVGSALGVVICSVIGFIVSFQGMGGIFKFMDYAWLVLLIIFLIMLGETGRFGDLTTPPSVDGATASGAMLTLFSIMYGWGGCCAAFMSDYYVEFPADIPGVRVFLLTFLGFVIPSWIGLGLGAVVASALPNIPEWKDQYEMGIGFLAQTVIYPYGLAKVILFLLVLAGIGLTCASMYSAGLSIQQFARPLSLVPRFVWTLLIFAVVILLGLAGSNELLVFLQNFLSLLGYYATAVFVCLFAEHKVFRRGSFHNYNLEAWDKPEMLPIGFAGGLAFACGIIGAVLGMATDWYTGVIANLIGDSGGDIGNELCFMLTLIVYVPARFVELKIVGR
ncbi:permease for cytosine/purines, uracil, thiamine, allantoin-domain-containing protein [Xylariaceae sp. FL0662B]|nr:permease for cytosine/purines, uracil, thiamine, allantoin-domain-containing protein [Xylariaceae sp. FL0662B]